MAKFDTTTLAIGVLSASLLAYVVHAVLQWQRLSHVPGPYWAAWSKGWMVKESLKQRQPIAFKQVNDKYGRLHFSMVFIHADAKCRLARACRAKRAHHRRPRGDAQDDGCAFWVHERTL